MLVDPLTRLPNEIASEIFKIYCADASPPSNKTPLILGEVCTHWRDITIATPQLWPTVSIHADIEEPYDLEVATEWLRRSRSLPLYLAIVFSGFDKDSTPDNAAFAPLIQLLRSHSERWREVAVDSSWQSVILYALFNNLEKLPTELGNLKLTSAPDDPNQPACEMNQLISPTSLHMFWETSTLGLPLAWDRLTEIWSFKSSYLDELLRIIRDAPNLETCDIVAPDGETQATLGFPVHPVINHSLNVLYTASPEAWESEAPNLLSFLTLPSLKSLFYTYHCCSPDDPDNQIVRDFLKRSSPPLESFTLCIMTFDTCVTLWSGEDLPITTLQFDPYMSDDVNKVTTDFLALLATTLDSEEDGLPSLRELQFFSVPITFPDFWSYLCDVFQEPDQRISAAHTGPSACELGVTVSIPLSRKLLRSVSIEVEDPLWDTVPSVSMHPSVLTRLLEMEKYGVEIILHDEQRTRSCLLSRARNIYP